MDLPNHPDVCHEYVKALRECGYRWLLVQEHSVEEVDGSGLRERYLPRRLVARNSKGEEVSIVALVKTQGSDSSTDDALPTGFCSVHGQGDDALQRAADLQRRAMNAGIDPRRMVFEALGNGIRVRVVRA